MGKINDIAEGNLNLIRSKLNIARKEIEDLASKRLEFCNPCEHNTKGMIPRCSLCGCVISAKVRVKHQNCPKNLWTSVEL
jgi:hypothetical protein